VPSIVVTHDGFVPGICRIPEEWGDAPVLVRLAPAIEVRGVVLDHEGIRVGAGVSVLAFDKDTTLALSSTMEELSRMPTVEVATTDPSGAFWLRRLGPDAEYTLVPCGRGWLPALPLHDPFSPGTDGLVTLEVVPGFGCLFEFADAAGGPIRTADGLSILTGLSYKRMEDVRRLSPEIPWVRASGIDPRLLERPSAWRIPILVGVSATSAVADRHGPVGGRLKIPGYDPVSFEGWAEIVSDLPTPPIVVPVTASSSGWGSILIRIANHPAPFPPGLKRVAQPNLIGVFMLEPGTKEPMAIAVRGSAAEEIVVGGVPSGTYRGWFRDTFEFFRYPYRGHELHVSVLDNSRTTIDIELPPHGSLILASPDRSTLGGPPVSCELSFEVDGEWIDAMRTAAFPYTPAGVRFMPIGHYRASLYANESYSYVFVESRGQSIEFEIIEGQRTVLQLGLE